MVISIAKRSYPTEVEKIIKKAILFKAYRDFVKSRFSEELVDYVFCYKVQSKSADYLYWNFIHETARQQINLGAHGTNQRPIIEEALHAPGKVDYPKLNTALGHVYDTCVSLLDSNFADAFKKSKQLEDFALGKVKLKPFDALLKIGINDRKYMKDASALLIDLAFGRKKAAEEKVAALLRKWNKKKPKKTAVTKHVKTLEKLI